MSANNDDTRDPLRGAKRIREGALILSILWIAGAGALTFRINRDLQVIQSLKIDPHIPPGTIMAYAGQGTPDGWLACDGRAVDPNDDNAKFAQLVAAIGSSWGDGSDGDGPIVNLPDLRGMFLRGAGTAPGDTVSREVGSLQEAQAHDPRLADFGILQLGQQEAGVAPAGGYNDLIAGNASAEVQSRATRWSLPAGASPRDPRPVNCAVNFIIRY